MTDVDTPITGGICQVPGCARLGRKSQDFPRPEKGNTPTRGDLLLCDEHYKESETHLEGFRRKHFPDFN
jgi:hypothetical protein